MPINPGLCCGTPLGFWTRSLVLGQDAGDYFGGAGDAGEAFLAGADLEAEVFVGDAEGGEDGGVEVAEGVGVLDGHEADVVGGADAAWFDAAASHPDGESGGVVLAAVLALGHGVRRSLNGSEDLVNHVRLRKGLFLF